METCMPIDLLLMTLWKLHGFSWRFLSWNSTHACAIKVLAAVVLHATKFIEIINSALKRSFLMLLLLCVLIPLIALPPHSDHAFVTGIDNANFAIQQICWYSSAPENRLTICFKDHSVNVIFYLHLVGNQLFFELQPFCFQWQHFMS